MTRTLPIAELQWLFDKAALRKTPSQADGITYEKELEERSLTVQYVQSLLGRTTVFDGSEDYMRGRSTRSLAAVLIHRFYMRRSLKDFRPELVSATILFIASKIEENAVKLRHIANASLAKFEDENPQKQWLPQGDHGPPPSEEYRRWEKDILSAEEVVQEALCFDMSVTLPWPILSTAIKELDSRLTEPTPDIVEARISRFASTLELAISHLPLTILHRPQVIAFAYFVVTLAIQLDDLSLNEALVASVPLSPRFGVEVRLDEEGKPSGQDSTECQDCIEDIRQFATSQSPATLDIASLFTLLPPESETPRPPRTFFRSSPKRRPSKSGITDHKRRKSASGSVINDDTKKTQTAEPAISGQTRASESTATATATAAATATATPTEGESGRTEVEGIEPKSHTPTPAAEETVIQGAPTPP